VQPAPLKYVAWKETNWNGACDEEAENDTDGVGLEVGELVGTAVTDPVPLAV